MREAIRTDTLGERLQVEFFRELRCASIRTPSSTSSLCMRSVPAGNMRHARIKFDDDVLNGKVFSTYYKWIKQNMGGGYRSDLVPWTHLRLITAYVPIVL